MKRLYFMGGHKRAAAALLFGEQEDFQEEDYQKYQELEVVLHQDGRFSVWGNLTEDADLLRDTKPDKQGVIAKLLPLADEVLEEEE